MHLAVDIGNVICEVELKKFTDRIKKCIPWNEDAETFMVSHQSIWDLGYTTVLDAVRDRYGITSSDELKEVSDAWNSTIMPNGTMLNLLESLKGSGVKIAFLSNMGVEHAEYLKSICPKMFEGCIEHLSFEVGARKPSLLYYQSFLLNNDEFAGAVFIDDRLENLKAAKKLRFKPYHFELDKMLALPSGQMKQELDKIKKYTINK